MTTPGFEIICEIEPATRPDLTRVRHQIGVLSAVAAGFLIPDNHIGRATVSSIAVAHEVQQMGGRSIACVNARDRNLLGFRRDLLTAAAYGVDDFLFVYGDRPASGDRTGQLTVRSMIEELRAFSDTPAMRGRTLRAGASASLGPLPRWKHDADALYVQVSWSIDELARWRETVDFDGPIYAGVMVLASSSMGRTLAADVPQLAPPATWIDAVDRDPDAGIEMACDHLAAVRDHGGFAGAHLIPVSRYRQTAALLETRLGGR
ncbi:MAG: methylenetetrahydrofolate reductase [Acidimicrobiales bacterium]